MKVRLQPKKFGENVKTSEIEFMRELQKQCVSESAEYTTAAYEALIGLSGNPVEALNKIMTCLHSIKGNVQAVGFLSMGNFIHEAEAVLVEVSEKLSRLDLVEGGEKELMDLEFGLSKVIQATDDYFKDLSETLIDSEEYLETSRESLVLIRTWMSDAPQVSTVEEKQQVPDVKVEEKVEKSEVVTHTPIVSREASRVIYLLCRNRGRDFAIPVPNVVEIVKSRNLSLVPCDRGDLMGLMNLRGEVLPVLDMSRTFGTQDYPEKSFIVICEVKGTRFGFPIENAEHIEELSSEYFQPATNLQASDSVGLINQLYVKGNRTIFMVDVNWLFSA